MATKLKVDGELSPTSNVARSPSHESFATDISLMSFSSLGSEIVKFRTVRRLEEAGRKGCRLQVPCVVRRPADVVFEEEAEILRTCGALSSTVGLLKSFSTSDIDRGFVTPEPAALRTVSSEIAISCLRDAVVTHVDPHAPPSRACSTWADTSQLPSPHSADTAPQPLTAADFVRSVNKKVRQMYIRRRMVATYRALERLTRRDITATETLPPPTTPVPHLQVSDIHISELGFHGANNTLSLSVRDIEQDKGKPLSKYDRNMMIFTWLQNLDEAAFDNLPN